MKKADAYKKGMQDAMQPFSEKINSQADALYRLREHIDVFESDIIDCIEWNIDNPADLLQMLKKKQANKTRIKQFRVSVIYAGKENLAFADALRKDLNKQKNTCERVDYATFTKHVGSLVDYRIYIGNPEKTKESDGEIIYKAYGMLILRAGNSYVVEYDPHHTFSAEGKEQFISYYESIISKSLERSKAAEKALKSRKNRKLSNPDGSDPKGTYTVLDSLTNSMDFWDNKPAWMTLTLGLPSMLITLIAMVFMIPVGIGELAFRETVENLREANFDNKFVADAQRQILEVKLVDLFMREQMQDSSSSESTVSKPESTPPCSETVQEVKTTSSDYISNDRPDGNSSQNTRSVPITVDGVIKEIVRCSSPDALRLQIEGEVIEGTLTVNAYCKLNGQEEVYQVVDMGFAGNLTECGTGRATLFTLKKI